MENFQIILMLRQRRLPVSCTMNHGVYTNSVFLNAIHDSVRAVNDFSAVVVSDFWNLSAEKRMFF